ncbi:MAG TPA: hypothetical protein VFO41_12200 [Alphaproteobacteria bacterium]|nr:hypothetical protein [Alphaproteobacteria bacterium]
MDEIIELPVATLTLFADLVERAWTGNLAHLTSTGGTPYTREAKGRKYWYWRPRLTWIPSVTRPGRCSW